MDKAKVSQEAAAPNCMCWQKCAMADNVLVSGVSFANHNSLPKQEFTFFFLQKIKKLPKAAGTDVAQAL